MTAPKPTDEAEREHCMHAVRELPWLDTQDVSGVDWADVVTMLLRERAAVRAECANKACEHESALVKGALDAQAEAEKEAFRLRASAAKDAATIAELRRAVAAVMAEALDPRLPGSHQRLAVAIDLLATAAQEPTP